MYNTIKLHVARIINLPEDLQLNTYTIYCKYGCLTSMYLRCSHVKQKHPYFFFEINHEEKTSLLRFLQLRLPTHCSVIPGFNDPRQACGFVLQRIDTWAAVIRTSLSNRSYGHIFFKSYVCVETTS